MPLPFLMRMEQNGTDRYYAGSSRYLYYAAGRPRYIYSDSNPAETHVSGVRMLLLAFYVPFFYAIFSMLAGAVNVPAKLSLNYDTNIVIDDRIDVLTDEEEQKMKSVFKQVQDESGVTPAFISLKNNDWDSNTTLEQEAYDLYVNDFADESHVLVVYSTDPETVNVYDDWNFQLMMCDNTGNASKGIFTENKTTDLREKLHEYFTARTRYSIGEAVDAAFSEELPSLMKSTIDYGSVFTAIAMLAFIVVHAMFMTGIAEVLYAKKKYKGVVPVSTDSKEYKCPYCGTVYTDEVRRKYGKCQSCGAPFTLEEEPDSTNFEKGNA